MKKIYSQKIFLLSLLLYSTTTYSEIYKSVDEDGNIIFTDKKPLTYSEEIELEEDQTIESNKSLNPSEINHNQEKNENPDLGIEISVLKHYKKMRPSLNKDDWHIHDPSRVIITPSGQLISVTGKAQEDGYNCGLETWYRASPKNNWEPH